MKDLTRRHLLLSEEEKEFIRNEYFCISMKNIAIFLRRDVNTINSFIKHEKLEWIGKYKQQAGVRRMGHIPHNKGQKMKPEVYEKIKHTLFSKGSKPHNTKKQYHKKSTLMGTGTLKYLTATGNFCTDTTGSRSTAKLRKVYSLYLKTIISITAK